VSILLQGLRIQEYRRPHSAHALVLTGEAGVHIQVSFYASFRVNNNNIMIVLVLEETV
jgi:hypothetical protein